MEELRSSFVVGIGDFFASLPPRAVTLETDCVAQLPQPPLKPVVELSFCQNYAAPPQVVCWLLVRRPGADPRLVRLPRAALRDVSARRALVALPAAELRGAPRSLLYWFAFTTAQTSPVLAQTVAEIFAQPSLTRPLLAAVDRCVRECGVDAADRVGQTMLHAAAYSGNTALIAHLVAARADVDAREEHGWTPLLTALGAGQCDAALRLLDAGAAADATCEHGLTALHVLCRWPGYDRRQTLLAARLLAAGVPVNARNSAGETPLLYQCKRGGSGSGGGGSGGGGTRFALFLLDHGADGAAADYNGLTPLHAAALRDDAALAAALLDRGLAPALDDFATPSPLTIARRRACAPLCRMLASLRFLPPRCLAAVLAHCAPADVARAGATCRALRTAARAVLDDPLYWAACYGLPLDLYVALRQLRAKQGPLAFYRTVPARLRAYRAGLADFVVPPALIPDAVPASMLVVAVTGPPNAGKATLIRRFCTRSIPPIDVDAMPPQQQPQLPKQQQQQQQQQQQHTRQEPFPSSASASPSSVSSLSSSVPSASPAATVEEEQEEQEQQEEDEEDCEVFEIDGQQLFFRTCLVRMCGQVVKACLFILEDDDPSLADETHPFRQIWEKCAVCMVVCDLSVPAPQAVADLHAGLARWRRVCPRRGRDNKARAALVVGNKTDQLADPHSLDVLLDAATTEGLLFLSLCARAEHDARLVDVAFKVACDVSTETVVQQSQRGTIVVPRLEQQPPQHEEEEAPPPQEEEQEEKTGDGNDDDDGGDDDDPNKKSCTVM